jgi:amino acid permease
MTALMPVNAPVMEFPRRFVSRGVGFAVGWIYWLASLPLPGLEAFLTLGQGLRTLSLQVSS